MKNKEAILWVHVIFLICLSWILLHKAMTATVKAETWKAEAERLSHEQIKSSAPGKL